MKKILVIEDKEEVRSSLTTLLECADYFVIPVSDGLQAIEYLKIEIPDLVISDIMMPVLDGYQILEYIRNLPVSSTIPFIFLSARVEAEEIERGLKAGADNYILKPFRAKELFQAIEKLLQKKV